MRKNASVSLVQETVERYGGNKKKLTAELKCLVKDGRKSGDLLLVGAAYCILAETCIDLDDEGGAFSNALKAVAFLKDTEAYELLARAYISLGLVYTYQDNPQMAMAMDETAYELVRKHRIKGRTRIIVLNSLSSNYHMLGDVQKGIRMLTECLSLMEADPEENLTGRAKYTLNLAQYYRDNQDLEKSRTILMSMAAWIEKVDFQALICDYYLRCAVISYMLDDPQRGDGFADSALTLVPNDICPAPVYGDLQELSHILSIRRDQARMGKILELMTALAEKKQGTLQQLSAFHIMADYYRAFGEPERALACYEKIEELYDTQKRETRETQLRLTRQMKAAEVEIRKLEKDNDQIRKEKQAAFIANQEKVSRMQAHIISGLANLIESRDLETGEHVARTRSYARALSEFARADGVYADLLDDHFISLMCRVAPLHDVGKIVVPDHILKKPGRLTPEEYDEIKRHASEGGRVVREVLDGVTDDEYLSFASDVATCHHEKWNGEGYPKGYSGEAIPLSARIMAIADVFDALVSERYYKKAMPPEKAFEIIREEAGAQFDPNLAQVFLNHKDEFAELSLRGNGTTET
jgi:response regulator RpfG family c-di-GMP phosphodiesterase